MPIHIATWCPNYLLITTAAERAAAKAERSDTIQSNRDWASAETVRRAWLRRFASRKSAPKTAAQFIAASLTRADHEIRQALTSHHDLAANMLCADSDSRMTGSGLVLLADNATEPRAQMITLVLVLAAYENRLNPKAWRAGDQQAARYLRYLRANGYELSPIETRACSDSAEQPGSPGEEDSEDAARGDREHDEPDAGESDEPGQ